MSSGSDRRAVDAELVQLLIAAADSESSSFASLLANPNETWKRLSVGNEPWRELGQQLEREHLHKIIRGLVAYSQAGGFLGGSVSPVIALYHALVRRFPADEPDVTRWVVNNRVNPWEPFGSMVCNSATTQAGRARSIGALASARAKGAAIEEERQQAATLIRGQRATQRLANAVRRGDVKAVEALLLKGAEPSRVKPLIPLAVENGRTAMAKWLEERGIE